MDTPVVYGQLVPIGVLTIMALTILEVRAIFKSGADPTIAEFTTKTLAL
jgi:hypothetical protein